MHEKCSRLGWGGSSCGLVAGSRKETDSQGKFACQVVPRDTQVSGGRVCLPFLLCRVSGLFRCEQTILGKNEILC